MSDTIEVRLVFNPRPADAMNFLEDLFWIGQHLDKVGDADRGNINIRANLLTDLSIWRDDTS